jgi:hypothetical protein
VMAMDFKAGRLCPSQRISDDFVIDLSVANVHQPTGANENGKYMAAKIARGVDSLN